jgi:hypothetical protein
MPPPRFNVITLRNGKKIYNPCINNKPQIYRSVNEVSASKNIQKTRGIDKTVTVHKSLKDYIEFNRVLHKPTVKESKKKVVYITISSDEETSE